MRRFPSSMACLLLSGESKERHPGPNRVAIRTTPGAEAHLWQHSVAPCGVKHMVGFEIHAGGYAGVEGRHEWTRSLEGSNHRRTSPSSAYQAPRSCRIYREPHQQHKPKAPKPPLVHSSIEPLFFLLRGNSRFLSIESRQIRPLDISYASVILLLAGTAL